ncbi:MAG: hypothetical protein HY883_04730 [Deltaproteobacteria bacterium]|nr:hypothetical protein [Deltaproteobacteria bacterium]
MANTDTVNAITDNLHAALQGQGIKFSRKIFEDEKSIPASLIPLGEIFYRGEGFEHTHGQRPGYAEIDYLIRVILNVRDHADSMREGQMWVHKIREALTVATLNTGDLAAMKYVSRVTADRVELENRGNHSFLNYRMRVRYREG